MTNVGTPISRLFVISTNACASKRALRSCSASGDSHLGLQLAEPVQVAQAHRDVLDVRDDDVACDELDQEAHGVRSGPGSRRHGFRGSRAGAGFRAPRGRGGDRSRSAPAGRSVTCARARAASRDRAGCARRSRRGRRRSRRRRLPGAAAARAGCRSAPRDPLSNERMAPARARSYRRRSAVRPGKIVPSWRRCAPSASASPPLGSHSRRCRFRRPRRTRCSCESRRRRSAEQTSTSSAGISGRRSGSSRR